MDVAIAGSSGLIGSALSRALQDSGARVLRLVRPGSSGPAAAQAGESVTWDPGAGTIDAASLEGVDAVVNLAGRAIEPRRWTSDYKEDVVNSRVQATALIAGTLAGLSTPPAVLVNASASGFYGDRGEETLTEASLPGTGFLADVCRRWEGATGPASTAGIRVVMLRTGIVLSPAGGAMGRMLPLFKAGAGGRLGSGKQWWSWIGIDDEVGAILHAINTPALAGPVNLTAPNPVTNAEFTTALAHALRRPAALAVPKFALRAAMGEFADEGLLASQRILPAKLQESGYTFASPDLPGAFQRMLHPA